MLSVLGLIPNPPGKIVAGKAFYTGQDLLKMSNEEIRHVRGAQIAMIFQDPMTSLNPVLTIGKQLEEPLMLHIGMTKNQARDRSAELLSMVGIPNAKDRLNDYPHQYSGGMRQRVMIAMALSCNPKLLIADEPTTALDVTIRLQILELLERLRAEAGMALLLITHDLNLVRRYADRVAVMEKGVLVEQGATADVIGRPQHPYTQKLVDSRPSREVGQPSTGSVVSGKNVNVHYPTRLPGIRGWFKSGRFTAVESVDFELAPGETLGVIGESGSGKTTLLGCLSGRLTPTAGRVEFTLRDGTVADVLQMPEPALRKLARTDWGVVHQNPRDGLRAGVTAGANVGERLMALGARHYGRIRAEAPDWLDRVEIDRGRIDDWPETFSSGMQQRLQIARTLVTRPRLVFMDEPTGGLDVSVQARLLDLVRGLTADLGLSAIIVTHDLAVTRLLAHRLLVMRGGEVVESGLTDQVLDDPQHPYTQLLVSSVLQP
jgi:microcin C transport system ATP-binding protein